MDVESITRLIIVDNRTPARLGKLALALQRPGVSVHIYDHHPAADGDIKGEKEIVEQVGATTTIMVELLRQKGLPVSALDATIFALGIYEETGSLTFVSTTERDVQAVAYLLSKGAQLNIVADFISRELTAEQISILNNLIESAKSYDINGVRVVISALRSRRICRILPILRTGSGQESIDVLFLVSRWGTRPTHRPLQDPPGERRHRSCGTGRRRARSAASAVVRDMTYLQTRERLIETCCGDHVKPGLLPKTS